MALGTATIPPRLLPVLSYRHQHRNLYNSINEYLNVLQSVQLPFAMLPVLHFSISSRLLHRFVPNAFLMGTSFASARHALVLTPPQVACFLSPFSRCTHAVALLVLGVNFELVISSLGSHPTPALVALVTVGGLLYLFLCLSMVWEDLVAGIAAVDRKLFVSALGFRSVPSP